MNRAISDKDIVDYLNSGIIATDCHGIITHINRQREKKLSITTKELIGQNILESLPNFGPTIKTCLQSLKPLMNRSVNYRLREWGDSGTQVDGVNDG